MILKNKHANFVVWKNEKAIRNKCKLVGTELPGDPQVFMNNLNKDADMFRSELSSNVPMNWGDY